MRSEVSISNARSFLFVPGNRPERFLKAAQSGADAIILDLEDSVPLDSKAASRESIAEQWPALMATGVKVVVRANSPETDIGKDDLRALAALQGLHAVMIPKCESKETLEYVSHEMPQTPILPIIESASGFIALDEIASSTNVSRLVVGHIDFLADTGMQCADDQRELDTLRFNVAMFTRKFDLSPVIDGVTVSVDDAELIRNDTLRSVRFGFGGKLCIHPKQVDVVHQTFAPSPQDLDWAKRVLSAIADSQGAAVQLDGKMVDLPVVLQAQRLIARAR
jgi:citrate lyase subunit beta/citryl-CoA lyase